MAEPATADEELEALKALLPCSVDDSGIKVITTNEELYAARAMVREFGVDRLEAALRSKGLVDEQGSLTTGKKPFNVFVRVLPLDQCRLPLACLSLACLTLACLSLACMSALLEPTLGLPNPRARRRSWPPGNCRRR